MEIKVHENDKTRLKLEFLGKTHTLCNLLAKELWNDSDVVIAGYTLEHPTVGNAVLTVETKEGSAEKALLDAVSRLAKTDKDFLSKFKSIAK